MIIFSKAQWDQGRGAVVRDEAAGTGPYIFKERQLSATSVRARPPPTGSGVWSTGKR